MVIRDGQSCQHMFELKSELLHEKKVREEGLQGNECPDLGTWGHCAVGR